MKTHFWGQFPPSIVWAPGINPDPQTNDPISWEILTVPRWLSPKGLFMVMPGVFYILHAIAQIQLEHNCCVLPRNVPYPSFFPLTMGQRKGPCTWSHVNKNCQLKFLSMFDGDPAHLPLGICLQPSDVSYKNHVRVWREKLKLSICLPAHVWVHAYTILGWKKQGLLWLGDPKSPRTRKPWWVWKMTYAHIITCPRVLKGSHCQAPFISVWKRLKILNWTRTPTASIALLQRQWNPSHWEARHVRQESEALPLARSPPHTHTQKIPIHKQNTMHVAKNTI